MLLMIVELVFAMERATGCRAAAGDAADLAHAAFHVPFQPQTALDILAVRSIARSRSL